MIIEELIELLRSAPRCGADKDDPEGKRYIIISDTLATDLADRLEKHTAGDLF